MLLPKILLADPVTASLVHAVFGACTVVTKNSFWDVTSTYRLVRLPLPLVR